MIQHVGRTGLLAAALLVALAACAQMPALDKRAIQGPTAEEIWTAMVMLTTGREPSFDEKRQWDEQMDRRLSRFLAQNPQIASSPDVQTFRFIRQVTVGMSKDQALLLLGAPVLATKDAAEIEKLARRFWPLIKAANPTEVWLYPQGWRLYFNESRVVDITQYLENQLLER